MKRSLKFRHYMVEMILSQVLSEDSTSLSNHLVKSVSTVGHKVSLDYKLPTEYKVKALRAHINLSRVMRKTTFWFLTWSNTNGVVQSQKMARGLKFPI